MEWQIATQTHRGNVRRFNEDALLVDNQFPLLMVADGMGGHEAGDVASRMLAEAVGAVELPRDLSRALSLVEAAIQHSNDNMIQYSRQKLDGQTIGSTVVAMLADGTTGACIWAGDSRLYRARNHSLQQITRDHSYVAELVRAGQLTAEEAANHPSSNVITRAVGASGDLRLDHETFEICLGDTFLLCSDGLYNEVSAEELLGAMLAVDVWQSSHQLLNLCLGRAARDNISFIICRPTTVADGDLEVTLTYYPGSEDKTLP